MIPDMRESMKFFEGKQVPGLQSTTKSVLDRLSTGDPWLDSDDGKRDLDALIQREPDSVLAAVMNGCPGDWRSIAGRCVERGLAPRTVSDLLRFKLTARSASNDGIEKCRLLIVHMEEQCISDMLADFVKTNNADGLDMVAVVNRELLKNTTVGLEKHGSGSLLHLALIELQPRICALLLQCVPDLACRQTSEGSNALGWAIKYRFSSMIEPLLKAAPALEHMQDKEGRTALHLAFLTSDIESARELLKQAKDPQGLVKKGDKHGWTVLHYLAAYEMDGRAHLLDILKKYPELLPMCGHKGETALHVASSFCSAWAAEALLGCAFFLTKVKNKFGRTPLDVAIEGGHAAMVGQLAGALTKAVDETGRTVLFAALKFSASIYREKKCTDIARILFDIVTNRSTFGSLDEWEILEEAAKGRGNGELIDLLLELDPGMALRHGRRSMTALHIAAESGNLDGAKCLIRSKLGKEMLHTQMKEGMRPIDLALQHGHVFVVDALLSADKHLSDKFGSLAAIFDTPTDRQAWRELALVIADNDYRGSLAKSTADEKFAAFTKKLLPLGDREIGQRLAMFTIWSNEAGELDDSRQGFGNGIAACRRLSELFSDTWLPDDGKHRWKRIRQEALIAIEKLRFDREPQTSGEPLPVSRLACDLLGRLLPLPTNLDSLRTVHVIGPGIDNPIEDTSGPVCAESLVPVLNLQAEPYIPGNRPLHEDDLEQLTQWRHEYSLNLDQYRQYFLGIGQAIGGQLEAPDFNEEK
jgi:ankyrin repeat protein